MSMDDIKKEEPEWEVASEDKVQNEKPQSQASEWNSRSLLVLLGAFFAIFTTVGFANGFGVFEQYYKTHQLKSKSDFDIVWIGSFQAFALFIFASVAGIVSDRTGPFIPLCIGSVCLLLGVFMTSLCNEYYQFFLAQGLLSGIGMAFLTIPCLAVVSQYFIKARGLAIGIVISGSSVGGVIWPIEANNLLNSDGVSFGWTLRIMGFTMMPLCALVLLTIGLLGKPAVKDTKPEGADQQPVERKKKTDFSVAKKPAFVFLCIGLGICSLGLWTPLFFVPSYGVSLGFTTSFSFYLLSITNAASFFGRILPGYVADRYGPFNILILAVLSAGIISFCWTAATSVAGVVVWTLAFGFASGSLISLQSTCAAKLSTPETRGLTQGLVLAASALAGLFGPPIGGELLKSGYLDVSMYCGAVMIGGAISLAAARLAQSRAFLAAV